MLPKDKDLMLLHLKAIRKALDELSDKEDDHFTWRINCTLIDVREAIRQRAKDEKNT